jgi:pimeloyl-ACP methyl ester carboxylesterase
MADRTRRAGLLGAAAAIAAAGAATTVAVQRRALQREEKLAAQRAVADMPGEQVTVELPDGVELAAQVFDTGSAGPTLVFCHGYGLDRRSWHHQWRALASTRSGVGRLVAFDQRGHGLSGYDERTPASISQLGDDLTCVIADLATDGPVIVAAHSMGGMAVQAAAADHGEFVDRLAGLALVATTMRAVDQLTFGIPGLGNLVSRRVLPVAVPVLGRGSALIDRSRAVAGDITGALGKRWGFGDDPPEEAIALLEDMLATTPFRVIADYYGALAEHDGRAGIAALARTPSLVLVGDQDHMTPQGYSREIAAELVDGDLVIVPTAGHMVMLEQPGVVSVALRSLVRRVG